MRTLTELLSKLGCLLLCVGAMFGVMTVFSARTMDAPFLRGRTALLAMIAMEEALLLAYVLVRRYPWEFVVRGFVVTAWVLIILLCGATGLLVAAGSIRIPSAMEFLATTAVVAVLNIMGIGRLKPARELSPEEAARALSRK